MSRPMCIQAARVFAAHGVGVIKWSNEGIPDKWNPEDWINVGFPITHLSALGEDRVLIIGTGIVRVLEKVDQSVDVWVLSRPS